MVEVSECPACNAAVPPGAAECARCGEVFDPQVLDLESLKDIKPESGGPGLRGRLLFYAGLVLVFIGGPGVALGSWLHDVFEIPIMGYAYSVFGPFNRTVSAVGLIVLVAGIVLLILALRLSRPVGDEYDLGARSEEEAAR